MEKLELPEVAQLGAQVGDTVHGDLSAILNDLQPNNNNYFVKEMTATMVRHFEVEGNIILGDCNCQLVHS